MVEKIVFPDPVALLVAALNEQLLEFGYTQPTDPAAPRLAVGTVPDPRPTLFVRILRTGGVAADLVIDRAMLTLESWADHDSQSALLASRVRAIVLALPGSSIAGVPVYRALEFSGPANLPDPESRQARHTQTVEVSFRGFAAA